MTPVLNHRFVGHSRECALLLVHPLGADLTFWDDVVRLLEERISCVACDLRGAGSSARAAEPVPLSEHAHDLERLRRHLGIDVVVPVGCAIGAMAAACYAAAYPQRTAALILSNPALRTKAQARAMLTERTELVRRGGIATILPGAVDRAFLEQPRDERYRRYYYRFASQDAASYALAALAILDADSSDDLARISSPTLVVAGAHDVLLPPAESEAVAERLVNAHLEIVDDAAHFVPFQRPHRFVELVTTFLDRCGLPARATPPTGSEAIK